MTDSYYLINDHIKFYFNIENLRIEYNGQQQSLEPKEARILKYVLENQKDGLIKSEAILDDNWDYWSDKKVLQKVLSTLRKKFKNIGVTENGFVAADSNYKINYSGVLINEAEQKQKRSQLLLENTLKYLKTALPVMVTVLVTVFALSKMDFGPTFSVGNIIQSTAIDGVSLEPALSSDGRAMAFTHKRDNSSQIYVKIDANLNYQILTEGAQDQVPAWSPSGRQLAFQRRDNGQCEIRMLRMDEHYNKVGQDRLVAKCDAANRLTSISWKDENHLFFTDTNGKQQFREIHLLNVNTGEITPYYTADVEGSEKKRGGSGHYFIEYNRNLDALFSLQSPNWRHANISRVFDDNTSKILRRVDSVIWSFDIFQNQLIFKDIDNQLKSFDIDSPKELTTIYKNPLKSIAYPEVSANSNKIAIVSGSVFKNSIHRYDLQSGQSERIFGLENLLRFPRKVGDELFYMSEETGIKQIYAYGNGNKVQITNFLRNQQIVTFAVSNNKKYIAISFADKTEVYARSDTGLDSLKVFPLSSSPAFSANSERILLSNQLGQSKGNGETGLVEYYIDGFTETGISIRNAKFGLYHQSGIIFVTRDNKLNRFKLNGIDTITEDVFVGSSNVVALSGDALYVSSTGRKPFQINLKDMTQQAIDAPIYGQITADERYIYYKEQAAGSMVIFKGELTEL